MTKEDISITYENNVFYCTKNGTKWISVDGEKWYGEEKRITDLENKIADIKANCDLAIEGREVKIKELELELTVEKDLHQEETNLHLHAEDYIKSLEQKLEQTEKDLADYQFNYPKIKELEKENAELKEKLKPENCLKLLAKEGYIKFTSEQFPKATEIIKGLYFIIQSRIDYKNNIGIADEMWRAEQFLKEIEK